MLALPVLAGPSSAEKLSGSPFGLHEYQFIIVIFSYLNTLSFYTIGPPWPSEAVDLRDDPSASVAAEAIALQLALVLAN